MRGGYMTWTMSCSAAGRKGAHLALSGPVLGVLDVTSAADIDVLAGLDEHVGCGDNVRYRGLAGVLSRDPEGDRDVVRGIAICDGKQAVYADEELGAAVVEGWRVDEWGGGGEKGED